MWKWLQHQRQAHRYAFWPTVVIGCFFVLIIVVAAVSPPEDSADKPSQGQAATEPKTETVTATQTETVTATQPETVTETQPKPTEAKRDWKQDITDAIHANADDGANYGAVVPNDLKLKSLEVYPPSHLIGAANTTMETPEGGFDGPSVDDLAGSAGAVFEAIFNDAGWRRKASVRFTGGLVDKRTGKSLPNDPTGIFVVGPRQAARIAWDNATEVDWKQYAIFLSPALKGG